jgi:hypothetical protein
MILHECDDGSVCRMVQECAVNDGSVVPSAWQEDAVESTSSQVMKPVNRRKDWENIDRIV